MSNTKTNKTEGEEAKASSRLLNDEHMKFSKHVGALTARMHFKERGDHSETHISEMELATLCAGAAGAAIKLLVDQAKKDIAEATEDLKVQIFELHVPDFTHEVFQRPVIIHLGKDGSIRWLNRANMTKPVVVDALMPVFSVETEEQAKALQVIFGRLQYRGDSREPGKPWYVLHRLPDGTMLVERPNGLAISDLPGITKMFATWYDALYGKKPENVRAS